VSKPYLRPLQLDIEVSAACQLSCVGCPINFDGGHGKLMSSELFHSILDRLVRERKTDDWHPTLVPWLNGEPLLHPHYPEFVRRILDERFRAYITTNGMIWSDEVFQLITSPDSSFYQIIFSLDGLPDPRSKSIEGCRPGSDRQVILANIDRFRKLKLEKKSPLDLAVKIVHRGQDFEEIEEYVYYWLRQPGIDFVVVGKMLSEYTSFDSRLYPCRYSDNMFMVITWDGDLVPCSYNHDAKNGRWFSKSPQLFPVWPNVRNDLPLLHLYNSAPLAKFRSDQTQGIFHGPCRQCGFAYTGHGFKGKVEFRDPLKQGIGPLFTSNDYYNTFYSLHEKKKPDSFYRFRNQQEIR
jgi:MoaA/NifB/PqqE/SkfB family radical SAM enzyme